MRETAEEYLDRDSNSIKSKNIRPILLGSSVLAGGGGGNYLEALEKSQELTDSGVEVRNISEFEDDDILATIFGMGPVNNHTDNFVDVARASAEKYSDEFGEMDGIILGELGPDLVVEALAIAQELDLPIVNADVAGRRAVPSIQHEIIEESPIERTPLVYTDGEKHETVEGTRSGVELEEEIRSLAEDTLWYVTGYSAEACKYRKHTAQGWFEKCLETVRNDHEILAEGRIREIVSTNHKGHTLGLIKIYSSEGITEMAIYNENVLAVRGDRVLGEMPESLSLINEDGKPVYNGDLPDAGAEVRLIKVSQPEIWGDNENLSPEELNLKYNGETLLYKGEELEDFIGEN
jgi:DUF917 family protein